MFQQCIESGRTHELAGIMLRYANLAYNHDFSREINVINDMLK